MKFAEEKIVQQPAFMTGHCCCVFTACASTYYSWSWAIFPVIIIFIGPAGVSEAQTVVKKVIDIFHKIEFPDKKPSGQ